MTATANKKLSPESINWYKEPRPIREILANLSVRLTDDFLATRKQGNSELIYLPWYNVCKILDRIAPGWEWEVKAMTTTADRLFLVGRLTIHATDGMFYREATGTELLKEEKQVWVDGQPVKDQLGRVMTESREMPYGDPSSNAESMALRRAAAKFGLALYLYDRD